MADTMKYSQHLVFGLDIGTRSIVGTVGYKEREKFNVVAQYVKEHDTRAMRDGQIHDINKVGETIAHVKGELEQQIGRGLTEVCIAAAGRVLRTVTVNVEYEFPEESVVNQEHIYSLDMLGVEKAHDEINGNKESDIRFYCVGYTVVRYYLNNYIIGNLENHRANKIGAELIATFLPEDVVSGLNTAVNLADLEVANLTLEPIAAINIAIPEVYRMLNIALVDVGAGTSDISITKDGSIIAYGMIPKAGDIVTETLAKHCLIDFQTAEKIKFEIGTKKKTVTYKDIMGNTIKIPREELSKLAEPVIEEITKEIADKIIELNGGKAVSAVFVVGGGGKINGFVENLAQFLKIQKERVALRGEEVLGDVNFFQKEIKKDPLLVTPVGICLNFYNQNNNFIFVNFNGERIKMYNNNRLTIVDVAIQAGFPNDQLFPRRGPELNFKVNGKNRMVRGEFGEAAIVTLNGNPVGINSAIEANDKIKIIGSTAGKAAELDIEKIPEFHGTIDIIVEGKKIPCPQYAEVNGSIVSNYYSIQNNDEIVMRNYYTVAQILEFMDIILDEDTEIFVNNKAVKKDEKVYENFSIHWTQKSWEEPEDTYAPNEETKIEKDSKEETEVVLQEKKEPINLEVTVNHKLVTLSGKTGYVFVDVFDQINFDLKGSKGREIVTLLNGEKPKYTQELNAFDVIEIYWKE
ncbi:cell division protein FtsA [Konateibacter massiliensis]|uniref:cell division protein FtsA n=1 Tax=Konateibacter massiliensis TaxID=2002841 RepID=UPI002E25D351